MPSDYLQSNTTVIAGRQALCILSGCMSFTAQGNTHLSPVWTALRPLALEPTTPTSLICMGSKQRFSRELKT